MGDDKQLGRTAVNSSKSIPPPPPPPPPPPLPSSVTSKPAPSLVAELSTVSLKHRPPPTSKSNNLTQSKKNVPMVPGGPFRLPPASTLKKVRPPQPPSSSSSPSPLPSSSSSSAQSLPSAINSGRSIDPLLAEISAVSLKSRSTQGGKKSVSNISNTSNDTSSGSFKQPAPSTLPKKFRPPLPPPPPPSVPPSGFSNNSNGSKFIPPPPPSQASSSSLKKPALPPKKIINQPVNTSESDNRPATSTTNLESRFRHIFKDLHTLPAPEPFLSSKKQYPSERKPRGPAPPIPSRSTSISNQNDNNESNKFNSTPMLHVQLEHQALGVNYNTRY
ncbi:uncharacterized protein LOC128386628 [Panonychus citri]|uniref:uncharacterized protein LOC128386628 n=1 Tax=Panonychus citri TaxID=50023 RepID=UPI002306E9D8|nr:uncharacterized protein LOC128386628 [Panonychus citri]